MGLSLPLKHPKTTPITFLGAIRRGQYSVFHVKSVHPNVHPLCAFRFSMYTQTYTQLYTQPRKTPLSDPIFAPQNAKTARTPPFSVFKPFNIRLSPVNPTFYISTNNPIHNLYKPLNLSSPLLTPHSQRQRLTRPQYSPIASQRPIQPTETPIQPVKTPRIASTPLYTPSKRPSQHIHHPNVTFRPSNTLQSAFKCNTDVSPM